MLLGKSKAEFDREFEKLMCDHEKMVYHTALGFLRQTEDAEDITQTVFLKAYRSYASFRRQSRPETWLYAICRNACIDLIRKRSGGFDVPLEPDGENELRLSDTESDETPEALVLQGEAKEMIWQAIGMLEQAHRQVLILRDMEGYSYALIAEMTELSEGTVKSRLFRARQRLAHILADGNYFEQAPSNLESERGR